MKIYKELMKRQIYFNVGIFYQDEPYLDTVKGWFVTLPAKPDELFVIHEMVDIEEPDDIGVWIVTHFTSGLRIADNHLKGNAIDNANARLIANAEKWTAALEKGIARQNQLGFTYPLNEII